MCFMGPFLYPEIMMIVMETWGGEGLGGGGGGV